MPQTPAVPRLGGLQGGRLQSAQMKPSTYLSKEQLSTREAHHFPQVMKHLMSPSSPFPLLLERPQMAHHDVRFKCTRDSHHDGFKNFQKIPSIQCAFAECSPQIKQINHSRQFPPKFPTKKNWLSKHDTND